MTEQNNNELRPKTNSDTKDTISTSKLPTQFELGQKIWKFLETNYTIQEYKEFRKEIESLGGGPLFLQVETSFSQYCLGQCQEM